MYFSEPCSAVKTSFTFCLVLSAISWISRISLSEICLWMDNFYICSCVMKCLLTLILKLHLDHSKIISLHCYLHKCSIFYRILQPKLICDICNPSIVVNCAVYIFHIYLFSTKFESEKIYLAFLLLHMYKVEEIQKCSVNSIFKFELVCDREQLICRYQIIIINKLF